MNRTETNLSRLLAYICIGSFGMLASCREEVPSAASSDLALQQRIQRVERGLIPLNVEGVIEGGEPETIVQRMIYHGAPGVGIAVINDFELEWAKGYGSRSADVDDPVTIETLFHAGSVAKPVSAAAALTLVDAGVLHLDEDVNQKLRSWQVLENEYTVDEKVTLRRLLSHSAGIRDGFTDRSSRDSVPAYMTPAGEAPLVTLQQLLNAESGVDVDSATIVSSEPGSVYRYANAGYAILELLTVDVAQSPFPEFMSTTILQPFEMSSSTYEQPIPGVLRSRAAIEHDYAGSPLEEERLNSPLLAAGGLWTTPSDLATFAIELMRAYHGQSNDVLSREIAREMLRVQIATPNDLIGDGYGLGLQLAGAGDQLLAFHTGGTWGSTSLLWFYPEKGQGAVIMTNSAAAQGIIRFEILLSLAEEYGWQITPQR